MKPIYFDLTVRDPAVAKQFFERVFDWRFERFAMPYEYYRISAGAQEEFGIDGGMGSIADSPICGGMPMTSLTVPTPNLDKTLAEVVAAGGRIAEPKMAIRGVGWYATCAEPGGLMFGVLQADASAAPN